MALSLPSFKSFLTNTFSFLFVVLIVFPISASPIPHSVNPRSSTPSCSFEGNPNLYGLGIRLGIYFQAFATIITNIYLPESVEDFRDNNAIFLFALLLATIKATINNNISTVDCLVILRIAWGFIISAIPIWGERTALKLFDEKTHWMLAYSLRMFIIEAFAVYNAWFWFRGVRSLAPVLRAPCEEYVFFFGRFDVQGKVRIFYRIVSIVLAGFYGVQFAGGAVLGLVVLVYVIIAIFIFSLRVAIWGFRILGAATCCCSARRQESHLAFVDVCKAAFAALAAELATWVLGGKSLIVGIRQGFAKGFGLGNFGNFIQGFAQGFSRTFHATYNITAGQTLPSNVRNTEEHIQAAIMKRKIFLTGISSLAFLTWSIVGVEIILAWNSVTKVTVISSVSQLIPFTIGVLGLVRTFRKIFFILYGDYLREQAQEMAEDEDRFARLGNATSLPNLPVVTENCSEGVLREDIKVALSNGKVAAFKQYPALRRRRST